MSDRLAVLPLLEVVVCTFNNADMLDDTLDALSRQIADQDGSWRCLVVDNNCTDHTPAVIERHIEAARIPGLRSVEEPEQGLTPARLRGVKSSTAPWIAFVDDDCILAPKWISEVLAFTSAHPTAGAFGGKVVLDWVQPPPPYVKQYGFLFAEQHYGESSCGVPFLVGAGLVVSRAALAACGWTAEPLLADRIGTRLVSGGDVEIVLRIAALGAELRYIATCELRHRIPSRRIDLNYLVAISHGLGVSQALADVLVSERSATGWLAGASWNAAREIGGLARQIAQVARGRRPLEEWRIQAAFCRGKIRGISRLAVSVAQRRRLFGLARR